MLAGSGHIAGVINPPAKQKYGYWLHDKTRGFTAEQWLKQASQKDGSWWLHWNEWQRDFSTSQKTALDYGNEHYKPIEDAPGSYVLAK